MNNKKQKLFLFFTVVAILLLSFYFVFYNSKKFNLKFVSASWNREEDINLPEQKNQKKTENEFKNIISEVKSNLQEKYFKQEQQKQEELVDVVPQKCEENVGAYESDCKFVAVIDAKTKTLLFQKNTEESTPIASITKLMTALVFLDYNPGWDKIYTIKESDRREGGKIYLYKGEQVKVKDLFYTSLIGSANTATMALISSTGMSEEEFVQKMNDKAFELGLLQTSFADPTGLSQKNISTAHEVALLARVALAQRDIRQATLIQEYQFETLSGRKKKIISTDYLLGNLPPNGIRIIGGKTGYTPSAGFCFTGDFLHEGENEIISAVLGCPDYTGRFTETKRLAEWIYDNYEWPKKF